MRNILFLSIIDRMMMNELLKTIFSALIVLVVIIVSRNFIKILRMAADGLISTEAIVSILGLKIVLASVNFMLPSVFAGVLMVLGRMYRDWEISALSSAGLGVRRLYIAVFKAIIPMVFIAAWMSLYVSPWAASKVNKIMFKEKQNIGMHTIAEGRFSQYNKGNLIFYVEKISADNIMLGVFVQSKHANGVGIITAEKAKIRTINNNLYLVFINGERVQGHAGEVDYIFESFTEYAMRLESSTDIQENPIAGIDSMQLLKTKDLKELSELHHRLSIPFGIIVLTMMAVPLAQLNPRSGVYSNLLASFLIYFSFTNFAKVSSSLMVKGDISVCLGFGGVYFLAALLIVILFVKLYGITWILRPLKQKWA